METTITLSQNAAGRIAIHVGGTLLATTKDGGPLIQRVDRILSQHRVHRASGYSSRAAGTLTATGADLR